MNHQYSLALAALLVAFAPTAPAQDDAAPAKTGVKPAAVQAGPAAAQAVQAETDIDKFIRLARTGSAFLQPQAAARLVSIGKPAGERLLELVREQKKSATAGLALFGTTLIEALGQFPDVPELRENLWPALEDTEFPWRPAAARGLAWDPALGEWERFAAQLDDPIGPVRTAALDGLFRISQRAREEGSKRATEFDRAFLDAAVDQLDDEVDRVRARAATLLFARGHARALWWLFEDLKRTDTFFDMPTGLNARYEAMSLLSDLGLDVDNYIPELPTAAPEGAEDFADGLPTSNAAALAGIAAAIRELVETRDAKLPEAERNLIPAEVPPIARAEAVNTSNVVLGLELKSCRRGDYFLRWTSSDELLIGLGNPARVALPEGTVAKLVEVSKGTQSKTGDQRFWGRPGCDVETYRMPRAGEATEYPLQLVVAKNEEPITDLRPPALTELGAALAASIPTEAALMAADERTKELARRIPAAFASIGGPVEGR